MTSVPDVVTSFAVYGTLRDDDDSGADWTQGFIKGHESIIAGKVTGYSLYKNSRENWPYALKHAPGSSSGEGVCVRVISFPADLFPQKLIEADDIENFDPANPESSMYQREVVTVSTASGPRRALLYHVTRLREGEDGGWTWTPLPGDDWLRRPRE
jgi:gamma-glutamylcyclotransferase (GGCT)/AIG2-like uncharacterized protein YtfP